MHTPLPHRHHRYDWKGQQAQAAFHQGLLTQVQAGAISFFTFIAVLLTLGGVMSHLSTLRPGEDELVLYIVTMIWLVCFLSMAIGYSRSAARVRATYLVEQARLFPGVAPYRLESFLLDLHDRLPRWLRLRG